jgi:hypothetical protein
VRCVYVIMCVNVCALAGLVGLVGGRECVFVWWWCDYLHAPPSLALLTAARPPAHRPRPTPPHAGAIDIKELKSAMQSLGFDAKNHTVFQLIADLDTEGEGAGSLDFDEFLHMMTAKMVRAC